MIRAGLFRAGVVTVKMMIVAMAAAEDQEAVKAVPVINAGTATAHSAVDLHQNVAALHHNAATLLHNAAAILPDAVDLPPDVTDLHLAAALLPMGEALEAATAASRAIALLPAVTEWAAVPLLQEVPALAVLQEEAMQETTIQEEAIPEEAITVLPAAIQEEVIPVVQEEPEPMPAKANLLQAAAVNLPLPATGAGVRAAHADPFFYLK